MEVRREWGEAPCSAWDKDWANELGDKRSFRSVEDDGASPGCIAAKRIVSLVDFVAAKPRQGHTKATYDHVWWKMLRDRSAALGMDRVAQDAILARAGLVLIARSEFDHGRMLGLEWPELAPSAPNVEELLASMPPTWANIDVLAVLLELYRRARDRGEDEMAGVLRRLLLAGAVSVYRRLPQGEPRDTWRFVVETRAINWVPEMEVPTEVVERHFRGMSVDMFDEKHTRGRPRLKPGVSMGGKVEQRWRRRAWILAANTMMAPLGKDPDGLLFSIQPSNVFTRWLVEHRESIDRQYKAAMLRALDDEPDPELLRDEPLNPPLDATHRQIRPPVDPKEEEVLGSGIFDQLCPFYSRQKT